MNNIQARIENSFATIKEEVMLHCDTTEESMDIDHIRAVAGSVFDRDLLSLVGEKFDMVHRTTEFEVEVTEGLHFRAVQKGRCPVWSKGVEWGERLENEPLSPDWTYYRHEGQDADVKSALNSFFRCGDKIPHWMGYHLVRRECGEFYPLLKVLEDIDGLRGEGDISRVEHAQLRAQLRSWAIQ